MKKVPENTGEIRNKKGQFPPGVSGNPAGKPPGALSITSLIKQELQKEALNTKGEKKQYIIFFIESMMKKAIEQGDHATQKMIWNYIDGMPKGSLDLTSKGQKINSFDSAQVRRIAKEVLETKEDE